MSCISRKLFPVNLSFFYPYPRPCRYGSQCVLWPELRHHVIALKAAKKIPAIAVGWFWFIGTLVPSSVLCRPDCGRHCDRYCYVPLIGSLYRLYGVFLFCCSEFRGYALALHCCRPSFLSYRRRMTRSYLGYWKNDITLYQRGIKSESG